MYNCQYLKIFMKWVYHLVHLNVEDSSTKNEESSNPQAASYKLKGSLTADFLKDQFPEQYHEKRRLRSSSYPAK